jgi:hypothetical protein
VLLAGVAYLLIGRLFVIPTTHVQAWRLAAWLLSGVVIALHIGHEHFRLGHTPRVTAAHAALAVAIGAFALAVTAMVRSMWITAAIRPVWLLALLIWPLATAVPALLVAFVAAAVLARIRPGTSRLS